MAWLTSLPVALLRAGTLAEPDTFWEIRTGLVTIEQRAIPAVDPFSWTALGEPWTVNSWAFNVVIGAAYRLAGCQPSRCSAPRWSWPPPGWSAAGVGVLAAIWVNLHAAALLGVAIVGATALLLVLSRTTRSRGWWCVAATAAALAGSMLNPYGVGLFAQTMQVKSASTAVIDEWQSIDVTNPTDAVLLLSGLVALVTAAWRRDAVVVGALAVSVAGGITAIRLLPILVLLAVPVLAALVSHPAVRRYAYSRRVVVIPGAPAGVTALALLALPALGHFGRPLSSLYPTRAVSAIPPNCRLFNSYLLGGFVLLQRPDVAVAVDSRNDLYGTERVVAAERVLRGEADRTGLLTGAGCVLVPPASGLALRLRTDPNWQVTSSETAASLFVRR